MKKKILLNAIDELTDTLVTFQERMKITSSCCLCDFTTDSVDEIKAHLQTHAHMNCAWCGMSFAYSEHGPEYAKVCVEHVKLCEKNELAIANANLRSLLERYESHDTAWLQVVTALNEHWPNWACREGHDGWTGEQMAVNMIELTRKQADAREAEIEDLKTTIKSMLDGEQDAYDAAAEKERERIQRFFNGDGSAADYPYVVTKFDAHKSNYLIGDDLKQVLATGKLEANDAPSD